MAGFQEITALHYLTGEPVRARFEQGVLASLTPEAAASAPPHLWIAPALFDLQINGYAGVDFQQDDLTADQLISATRALHRDGCASIFLTLVTDDWPVLLQRFRHLRQLKSGSRELARAIAGWHVEGPFLSARPGFHGAHPPQCMRDPTEDDVDQLCQAAAGDPLLLTLAPERPRAMEIIRYAASRGVHVSLGHTDASAAQLSSAIQHGATGFTHLGNACPKDLDRHDNILWRVLDEPRLTVGLIADGIHLSPPLFRLIHRAIRSEKIYYTTDAMAAAGAPPGEYTIGRLRVCVGQDQIVRQPGQSNFAGSALRPIQGIWRAARMLGKNWNEVWPALSTMPANYLRQRHGLMPGCGAAFCLLEFDPSSRCCRIETYVDGAKAGETIEQSVG